MCEFCNLPGNKSNRDALHSDFAGFFSADAIEAAVRQAKANKQSAKKRTNEARKQQSLDENDNDDNEQDEGTANVDDDGT